jgi:NADH:ubiquinone reductase (non-electrogenic)
VEKIKHVLGDIYERYPQVKLYLKSNQMKDFHDVLKHSEGKETKELNIEEFKKALAQVDSQVKMLPATAQVKPEARNTLVCAFGFSSFRCIQLLDLPEANRQK